MGAHSADQMARYDVRLILKGPVREPRIAFGYKMPDGTQSEYSLPMSLRERGMQCLWFVNADALRIALLQNMAARSNLRFDPDIFVEAGIDPETWHLMPKPRKVEWAIAIASMAAVLIFGSFISATTSVVLVVGVFSQFWDWAFLQHSVSGRELIRVSITSSVFVKTDSSCWVIAVLPYPHKPDSEAAQA